MSSALVLILVVVGGYLAAHVASGWLARRFLVVSGAEYLLLGILLGPQVSGLIGADVFGGFAPFLTLALGWVGVVVGAQFSLPELVRIPATSYRISFFEAFLTLAAVSAAMTPIFSWIFDMPTREAVVPAVALGAVATASAPTGIALVARRLGGTRPVVRQLQLATAIDALVAIVAFSLLLTLNHSAPVGSVRAPTATEWAVISVAIGVGGGTLFHLFLGDERKVDRLFISLAGATILASGAAAYLSLSPLLPTMLIGAILANTSGNRDDIRRVLGLVERPLYFVLLIFAGAAWEPSTRTWLLPVLAFLAVRAAGKVGGGYAAARLNGAHEALGWGWGRALLGQGGLAVAIALNYLIQAGTPVENVVFTAVLVSVILTDVASARIAESVVDSARRRRAATYAAERNAAEEA
jgi:Kef-type K+ transport system membrane component KefB